MRVSFALAKLGLQSERPNGAARTHGQPDGRRRQLMAFCLAPLFYSVQQVAAGRPKQSRDNERPSLLAGQANGLQCTTFHWPLSTNGHSLSTGLAGVFPPEQRRRDTGGRRSQGSGDARPAESAL